jgi:uncharacterized membrane protein YadS
MSAALTKLFTVMGLVGFAIVVGAVSSFFEQENKSNKTEIPSTFIAFFMMISFEIYK